MTTGLNLYKLFSNSLFNLFNLNTPFKFKSTSVAKWTAIELAVTAVYASEIQDTSVRNVC